MKTISLLKTVLAVLLGITLSLPVLAGVDKNIRHANPALKSFTHTITLNLEDIRNMQKLFSGNDAVRITWDSFELKFAIGAGETSEYTIRFEVTGEETVEDWMFESDYLSEESTSAIESWMLETEYLDEEAQPLESWMFSESRLSGDAGGNGIEPWMLDANYLSK